MIQGFDPNDLIVSHARADRPSIRPRDRADGSPSFSEVLDKASARVTPDAEKQENDSGQQAATVESNRVDEKKEQATHAVAVRERHLKKAEEVDQRQPIEETQTDAKTADADASPEIKKEEPEATDPTVQTSEHGVTVKLSWKGPTDDLKVSVYGLPGALVSAILSAMGNQNEPVQIVPAETASQATDVTAGGTGQPLPSDDCAKLKITLPADATDALKVLNEIFSLIKTLTEAVQNKTVNMQSLQQSPAIADVLPEQNPSTVTVHANRMLVVDPKATDWASSLVLKERPHEVELSVPQEFSVELKGLFPESSIQSAPVGETKLDLKDLLNMLQGSSEERKAPQTTDMAEPLTSKIKLTFSMPGFTEGANGTTEKTADVSSQENESGRFADQGSSMQTAAPRQETVMGGSKTATFGSIVADRLAAVAEQVGLRDKPLDVMLRLKMDTGESLLVALKDQGGKIMVQVKCADQGMVNLLESQKETIVRHLEAKQISSTISVSPIEEDLTKRQSREQPRNMWGRRQQQPNPYVEFSI